MILDNIQFIEEDDIDTGRRILSATYQAIAKTECDISTDDHIKRDIKLELAKAIRDQLVRDLYGFF